MTKVGEPLPAIVETSTDEAQSSSLAKLTGEEMFQFSASSNNSSTATGKPSNQSQNPYKCYCRPGIQCRLHLASSRWPEPRH